MRTETDLRDAFVALAELADEHPLRELPAPAAPAPHDGRRRFGAVIAVLGAAAAVAAVAVVVPHWVNDSTRRSGGHGPQSLSVPVGGRAPASSKSVPVPAAPPAFDPRLPAFTLDPMNGVSQTSLELVAEVQSRGITLGDGRQYAVAVYPQGGYAPRRPADARTVRVNGATGFYGTLPDVPLYPAGQKTVGVAWRWAGSAWATVIALNTGSRSVPVTTMLAEAVHAGASTARTPIRVTADPPGLKLDAVYAEIDPRSDPKAATKVEVNVDFVPPRGAGAVTIDLTHRVRGEGGGTPLTVDGHPALLRHGQVTVRIGGYVVNVGQLPRNGGGYPLTTAQLVTVAKGLRFAPITDYAHWFDAASALPR